MPTQPARRRPSTISTSGRVLLGIVDALLPVALHAAERDAALVLLLEDELRVADRARLRDRLVPPDEVALLVRPVRAAVERLAATRSLLGDVAAATGPRALHAERDRLGRLALGVLRAREEAAEPSALHRHRRAAGLADLIGGLRRDLLPRTIEVLHDLHGVTALGIALACEEAAVAAPLDDHRLAALLAHPLGRD